MQFVSRHVAQPGLDGEMHWNRHESIVHWTISAKQPAHALDTPTSRSTQSAAQLAPLPEMHPSVQSDDAWPTSV